LTLFDFVNFAAAKLQYFLLIMFRASGLFLMAPVLSHRSIPMMVKVGLVILLSVILLSALNPTDLPPVASLAELVTLVAKELLVGMAIGFVFALLMLGVEIAGDIISYQIGFTMASVIDPSTGQQVSTISQFWLLTATLVFIGLNGHHIIISAFNDSYLAIPVGKVVMNGSVGELMMVYSAYAFVIALKLAAPVVVSLLLIDVAMGVLSRLMPTMNVFILGFTVKVGVGLIVIALSLPVFSYVLEKTTGYLNDQLGTLLTVLGRA
jgi:flagellar biosynthetic protein FliR